MSNHFYGSYHWEFRPVDDRVALLDALRVFCGWDANLFIETVSPSLVHRFRLWRMRSHYRTHLIPDLLSPRPTIFHLALNEATLTSLQAMVKRDGLDERSLRHLKGYAGERGLFWFHGFCDEADHTLCCSRHVDDETIEQLESALRVKAEKVFGKLKSDRERREELEGFLVALNRLADSPIPPADDGNAEPSPPVEERRRDSSTEK